MTSLRTYFLHRKRKADQWTLTRIGCSTDEKEAGGGDERREKGDLSKCFTDKPLGECLFLTGSHYTVTIETGTSTFF